MRNRNYFERPIQSGGRCSYDYGHTVLHRNRRRNRLGWPLWLCVTIVTLYFVWQFTR